MAEVKGRWGKGFKALKWAITENELLIYHFFNRFILFFKYIDGNIRTFQQRNPSKLDSIKFFLVDSGLGNFQPGYCEFYGRNESNSQV